jgi:cell pole-organizing protein PopZ
MRASGGSNPTLDELVREALKPVLREWLDRNLPPMVETMVREEIQRLAASGRRR